MLKLVDLLLPNLHRVTFDNVAKYCRARFDTDEVAAMEDLRGDGTETFAGSEDGGLEGISDVDRIRWTTGVSDVGGIQEIFDDVSQYLGFEL